MRWPFASWKESRSGKRGSARSSAYGAHAHEINDTTTNNNKHKDNNDNSHDTTNNNNNVNNYDNINDTNNNIKIDDNII